MRILENHNFDEGMDYLLKVERVDDGRTTKNIYMLSPDAFKIICMRSIKTRKFARYYLLLEKCVKYYNEYEKLKLEQKINEINKIKILKLEKSDTLDNFIIIKCDEDTLHIRKYKDIEYIYKHNYIKFPYATIKGSNKNVSKILKKNKFNIHNILINIQLPSQNNFNKKINETLKNNIIREKVYFNKNTEKIYFGDIDDIDEEEEDEENNDYTVSVTKFFKLENITENDFINKVKNIDRSRFDQ